jgi:hypothetical protein
MIPEISTNGTSQNQLIIVQTATMTVFVNAKSENFGVVTGKSNIKNIKNSYNWL